MVCTVDHAAVEAIMTLKLNIFLLPMVCQVQMFLQTSKCRLNTPLFCLNRILGLICSYKGKEFDGKDIIIS